MKGNKYRKEGEAGRQEIYVTHQLQITKVTDQFLHPSYRPDCALQKLVWNWSVNVSILLQFHHSCYSRVYTPVYIPVPPHNILPEYSTRTTTSSQFPAPSTLFATEKDLIPLLLSFFHSSCNL
ncbi:hypothetical protein B566_EDAN014524 [Ephemera danica]|nr:hypothetical protein B566_EDAN014524 [Ephemera danica]